MSFNEKAWIEACGAWDGVSSVVGFETRKDAFLQGYYMAYNKLQPQYLKQIVNNTYIKGIFLGAAIMLVIVMLLIFFFR